MPRRHNGLAAPRRASRARPPRTDRSPQTVLVFQGGGALGAYQAGVYESLQDAGITPDWVVGTSIGAINGALIAGNRPERRLERLREFWRRVGQRGMAGAGSAGWAAPWLGAWQTWITMTTGIPGFFTPRVPLPWNLSMPGALNELSFYETAPLRDTLRELIDFDWLAAAQTRLTLCAVDVETAELARFDNRKGSGLHARLGPEHIMASGALPPGFAPVAIGRHAYWDGGIYSNTPLDIVLDDEERSDMLCFMVDLWDATETTPHTLAQAMMRLKDIQYASRTHEHIRDHARLQNLRRALRQLGGRLPKSAAHDPALRELLAMGCDHAIDIVHLVMKALPGEDSFRDIDFSQARLQARWQAGVRDGRRALQHKWWLVPPPDHLGMRVHTLPQEAS